jgi:hypothetical protein
MRQRRPPTQARREELDKEARWLGEHYGNQLYFVSVVGRHGEGTLYLVKDALDHILGLVIGQYGQCFDRKQVAEEF